MPKTPTSPPTFSPSASQASRSSQATPPLPTRSVQDMLAQSRASGQRVYSDQAPVVNARGQQPLTPSSRKD